ncbi:class A beta-lactamase-related serine hydrolase [Actinobaculum sp. 352]|nr:penicillin-binding protein [Actinobaculum sp. 313]RTE48620.1 class A beta-lactamase-related serine hydrolase [Actinobaculum sp. 352]
MLHTVGDSSFRFPLASVTKLLSAWAVLSAVEHGLLTLDDAAGPPGSTVRHLLAHASGLPAERGEPIAPPWQRRIYSNYGFELLGEYTATRVGASFQEWIEESVLLPLGMADTDVDGSPAHSGISTVSDLALFAVELLHPRLISHELQAVAATVQFPGLAGILPGYGRQQNNDWGLGVEIRGHKAPHWTGGSFSPRTFGHFGQSGSFLWVDPIADGGAGRAGIFLGAERFGPAHVAGWPELTNAMRTWRP